MLSFFDAEVCRMHFPDSIIQNDVAWVYVDVCFQLVCGGVFKECGYRLDFSAECLAGVVSPEQCGVQLVIPGLRLQGDVEHRPFFFISRLARNWHCSLSVSPLHSNVPDS